MVMECFYCVQSGYRGSLAAALVDDRPVCRVHLPDHSFPVPTKGPGRQKTKEEITMPARKIDLEELRRRFSGDKSAIDLAAEMGVRPAVIRHALGTLGLKARACRGRPKSVQTAQPKAAIVKAVHSRVTQTAQIPEASANGQPKARCRVAMFELEGSEAAVLAAVEAVKAALERR
jgi:hypothetical protein